MIRFSFLLVIFVSSVCSGQSANFIGDGHYTAELKFMGARVTSVRLLQTGKSSVAILQLDDNRDDLHEIAVLLTVPADKESLQSIDTRKYILLKRKTHLYPKQGLKWYAAGEIILAPDADKVVDIEPL